MGSEQISYRGKLLISNSSIITDDFNQTVIIIAEHDSNGAFGLAINKQSDLSIQDVVMGIPSYITKDFKMYWGGPVDYTFISILHNNSEIKNPGIEIVPGVYLSRSYELLIHLIETNHSKYHVFHGYSGWGSMQLESEFERKSWVVLDAKQEFIFHEDPELVWREALKSKGGIYKYFAEKTKDPFLN